MPHASSGFLPCCMRLPSDRQQPRRHRCTQETECGHTSHAPPACDNLQQTATWHQTASKGTCLSEDLPAAQVAQLKASRDKLLVELKKQFLEVDRLSVENSALSQVASSVQRAFMCRAGTVIPEEASDGDAWYVSVVCMMGIATGPLLASGYAGHRVGAGE